MRFIQGPFFSKEYADGACFAFEKAARYMSWEKCENCKKNENNKRVKPVKEILHECLSPEKCTNFGWLENRFREYKETMKKGSTTKDFALFCACGCGVRMKRKSK